MADLVLCRSIPHGHYPRIWDNQPAVSPCWMVETTAYPNDSPEGSRPSKTLFDQMRMHLFTRDCWCCYSHTSRKDGHVTRDRPQHVGIDVFTAMGYFWECRMGLVYITQHR